MVVSNVRFDSVILNEDSHLSRREKETQRLGVTRDLRPEALDLLFTKLPLYALSSTLEDIWPPIFTQATIILLYAVCETCYEYFALLNTTPSNHT